jgi:hypothetical protein
VGEADAESLLASITHLEATAGTVKTINGVNADAAGNVALDHLTKNGVNLSITSDSNAWIGEKRALRNNDIVITGGINSMTVPSGGTWAVFAIFWTSSHSNSAPVNGVYAGGTVLKGDANAHLMVGLCIKIT